MQNALIRSIFSAQPRNSATVARSWRPWLQELCAVLGVTLLLSGIICFFAFNWAELSKWTKFAMIIVGGLAVCLIITWKLGAQSKKGEFVTCASSMLVGVFFAVFGQIYQTGANTWQLFAVWAAVITPWTLVSRNAAQWTILLALLNISIYFYYDNSNYHNVLYRYLILLNGAFFGLQWFALTTGQDWLKKTWARLTPALLLLVVATTAVCSYIFDPHSIFNDTTGDAELLLPASMGALVLAALVFLFKKRNETVFLALTLLCGYPVIILFLFKLFLKTLNNSDLSAPFAIIAIVCVGYTVLITSVLRTVHKHNTEQKVLSVTPSAPEVAPPAHEQAAEAKHTEPQIERSPETQSETQVPTPPHLSKTQPLVITAVHAIGGFLAAIFLTAVFSISLSLQSIAIVGVLFLVAGSFLYRLLASQSINSSFGISFCLTLALAGIIMGLSQIDLMPFWQFFTAALLIGLVVYVVFDHALMRFIIPCIWLGLLWWHGTETSLAWPLQGVTVLCGLPLIGHALRVSLPEKLAHHFTPALYAAMCMFVSIVSFMLFTTFSYHNADYFENLSSAMHTALFIVTATLILLMLVEWRLIRQSVCQPDSPNAYIPLIALCLALACLAWLGATGILLGIALLALGHGRDKRPLSLIGLIFLPTFLFRYYYSLQITLLEKSYILIGSGLALLLIVAALQYAPKLKGALCAR